MNDIVIATDGSLAAQTAVEDGPELARHLRYGAAGAGTGSRRPILRTGAEPRDHPCSCGRRKALAAAQDLGVEAEAEILDGDVADEIVRVADARTADLIVVGSRARKAGALIGSVSRAVVRKANTPVPVAKHRGAEIEAAA